MVLHKSLKDNLGGGPTSSATILGLKVVGGKLLPNGRYSAIIEKVKKGSVADTVGHLLPGKPTTGLHNAQWKKLLVGRTSKYLRAFSASSVLSFERSQL